MAKALKAGTAYIDVTVNSAQVKPALASMSRTLDDWSRRAADIGMKTMMAASAIAVPLGMSMRVFTDFERQMGAVRAITKATGDEIKLLREQAKELGRTTFFTTSQVAEAQKFLGMAGFNPKQILGATPAVLDLALAGDMDLGTAADIATNISTPFRIAAEDLSRVNDVLASAATSSNTTIEEMGQAFKYAAPAAAAAGQSIEECAAAMAILANNGIKADTAGTSMRMMMIKLADSGIQQKLMTGLGVKVTDKSGEMRPLLSVLREMDAAMTGMSNTEKMSYMFDIFEQRAGTSALVLSRAGDAANEFRLKMLESTDAAKEMAEIRADSIYGDWIALKSAAEGVQIAVGEALNGMSRTFLQYLTSGARALADFISAHPQVIQAAGSMALAVGGIGSTFLALGMAVKIGSGALNTIKIGAKALEKIKGIRSPSVAPASTAAATQVDGAADAAAANSTKISATANNAAATAIGRKKAATLAATTATNKAITTDTKAAIAAKASAIDNTAAAKSLEYKSRVATLSATATASDGKAESSSSAASRASSGANAAVAKSQIAKKTATIGATQATLADTKSLWGLTTAANAAATAVDIMSAADAKAAGLATGLATAYSATAKATRAKTAAAAAAAKAGHASASSMAGMATATTITSAAEAALSVVIGRQTALMLYSDATMRARQVSLMTMTATMPPLIFMETAFTAAIGRRAIVTSAMTVITEANAAANTQAAASLALLSMAQAGGLSSASNLVTGTRLLASGANALALTNNIAARATTALTVAGSRATTALTITTGAAAGTTVATKGLAAAIYSIPGWGWALAGATAVAGLGYAFYNASHYSAKLSAETKQLLENMRILESEATKQVEQSQAYAKNDILKMQIVTEFSLSESLSLSDFEYGKQLIDNLQTKYGDLGITIDEVARKINFAADSQERFALAAGQKMAVAIELRVAELDKELAELDKEKETTSSHSYKFWHSSKKQADELNRIAKERKHIENEKKRLEEKATKSRGGDLDTAAGQNSDPLLPESDGGDSTIKAVDAAKRLADINQTIAKERRTQLENEIASVKELSEDYKKMLGVLIAFEERRPEKLRDKGKLGEWKTQLAEAEKVEQERINRILGKIKSPKLDVEINLASQAVLDAQLRFDELKRGGASTDTLRTAQDAIDSAQFDLETAELAKASEEVRTASEKFKEAVDEFERLSKGPDKVAAVEAGQKVEEARKELDTANSRYVSARGKTDYREYSSDDEILGQAKAAVAEAQKRLGDAMLTGNSGAITAAKKNLETTEQAATKVEYAKASQEEAKARQRWVDALNELREARTAKAPMEVLAKLGHKTGTAESDYQSAQQAVAAIVSRMQSGLAQANQTANYTRQAGTMSKFDILGGALSTGKVEGQLDKIAKNSEKTEEHAKKTADNTAAMKNGFTFDP